MLTAASRGSGWAKQERKIIMGWITYSYKDHTDEPTAVSVPIDALTSVNIDARLASALSLQAALEDVLLGNLVNREVTAASTRLGSGPATSPHAQRESKALVYYHDDTAFVPHKMTLPCPDLTKQNPDYPGVFYMQGSSNNHADWVALVSEINLLVDTGEGGNIVVDKIVHVGRNL